MALIGPLGDLREIGPRPGIAVEYDSEVEVTKSLGGQVYVQRPPSSRRTWELDLSWANQTDLSWLIQLEQGVRGDQYHFYDPIATQVNMLRARDAAPGIEPAHGWTASGTATLTTAAGGVLDVNGDGAQSVLIPVVIGRTYTARVVADVSARVSLSWRTAADVLVSADSSANGTGARTVSAAAPATTAGVRVVIAPAVSGAVSLSELQLTETGSAITWQPGMGIPRVVLSGVAEVYQAAWSDSGVYRRDHSVAMVEVG